MLLEGDKYHFRKGGRINIVFVHGMVRHDNQFGPLKCKCPKNFEFLKFQIPPKIIGLEIHTLKFGIQRTYFWYCFFFCTFFETNNLVVKGGPSQDIFKMGNSWPFSLYILEVIRGSSPSILAGNKLYFRHIS